MGITASLDDGDESRSPYSQAKNLPSGETTGREDSIFVSLTGVPPSMLTFQCLYCPGSVSKFTEGGATVCSTARFYYGFKRSFKPVV